MNIIRKVFRFLFQPIQVEFTLIGWVLLLLVVFISKVEIVCK